MIKYIILLLLNLYSFGSDVFIITTKDTMRVEFNNININNVKFKLNTNQQIFEIYNNSILLKSINNINFNNFYIFNKNIDFSYIELKTSK